MYRRLSPEALSTASARHPVRTLVVWFVAVVAAVMTSSALLDGALTSEGKLTSNPESLRAKAVLEERLGADSVNEAVILHSDVLRVGDAAFDDSVAAAVETAPKAGAIAVFGPDDDPTLVSADGHTALVQVAFPDTGDVRDHQAGLARVLAAAEADKIDVRSFGAVSIDEEIGKIADEDLAKGEAIGILVALIVLVIVFGALVASLLPIAVAVVSIAIALGLAALIGQAFSLSLLVTNMVSMMGLAVGIDYSLFVVSRYREERAKGREKIDAIGVAGSTASRAVVFSGMTVVIALLGMFIVPHTIFRSLAVGASLVVAIAVVASLTLLPALLSLLGDRIEKGRIRRHEVDGHPFWARVSRAVMRRPVVWLVAGTSVMVLLALPALGLRTGFSGIDALPPSTEASRSFSVLTSQFGGARAEPIEVVVDGDVEGADTAAAIDRLVTRLERDGEFGPASVRVEAAKDLAIVSVAVRGNPNGDDALRGVERIRDDYVPAAFVESDAEVLVGGDPARTRDEVATTNRYTPIAILFVLTLSFVLLMIVFRSIVVPIKAILLNLLSVAAAYGVIVLVCQNGFGASIFGFRDVDVIESWLPLFLFSVLFGLSMDYHVFLLSRIREHYDETGDNADSVAFGIQNTGRLITGAALIMVAVFGGFALGRLGDLQQTGLGLAVAVLLDATIVRMVLVPASMRLLGTRNWYFPSWLEWLPRIGIEGPPPRPVPSTDPPDDRELVHSG
ncbi:MAG: MMPL family transporter [Acidimicrobiia bacterium]|jgi:RND superfamily putative drug exporter